MHLRSGPRILLSFVPRRRKMWGRPKRPTFLLPIREWICLVLFSLIRIFVLTVVKAEYPEQFLAEGSPMTDRGWGREKKMYGILSGIDLGSKIVCLSRGFLGIQVFNLWGSSPMGGEGSKSSSLFKKSSHSRLSKHSFGVDKGEGVPLLCYDG